MIQHEINEQTYNKVTIKEKLIKFFTFNNIILLSIFSALICLVYTVLFSPSFKPVEIPIVDLTKQISNLEQSNRLLLEKSDKLDLKLDSLNHSISNSKTQITNIYKSIENEKEFLQQANDTVNYLYFAKYVNDYAGSN